MRAFILVGCLLAYLVSSAQALDVDEKSRFNFTFGAGYLKTVPGERLRSSGPGWAVDMVGRYSIHDNWWIGFGYFWGATPEVDAPEFDVFAPLDHPIWFESSQYFLEMRNMPSTKNLGVQPFYAFRLGWTTEFSEYSGPVVERKGFLLASEAGLMLRPFRFLSIDPGLMLSWAQLGNAQFQNNTVSDSSSGALFLTIKGGVSIWL